MKLKNNITKEIVRLPFGFYWRDEFKGSHLAEREERGATGVLHLYQQEKIGGLPFTVGAAPDRNWIDATTLRVLYAWLRTPLLTIEVSELDTVDPRSFEVSFNQVDGKPIDAELVIEAKPLHNDEYYHATFNFRIHKELTL